jgi:RNA polymerase sigma factor (sigma-70 family)
MTTMDFNHKLISMEDNIERFALSLTYNREKAKDLLQETYLKALYYKDKYVEVANFNAWVFTIMKNTFINNYRKSVREKAIIDNTKDFLLTNNLEISHIGRPFSELAYKEINGAISSLEDELKVPFIMHTKGYKYKEIAETLNINIGTVKSRIFLARKKLMETLNDYQ